MSVKYTAIDLRDIIKNKNARNAIPLVESIAINRYMPNYMGRESKRGRVSKTVTVQTKSTDYKLIIYQQIYIITRRIARPYFSSTTIALLPTGKGKGQLQMRFRNKLNLSVTKSGGDINVTGTPKVSLENSYNGILRELQSQDSVDILQNMADDAPIMQEVFNEISRNKPKSLNDDKTNFTVYIRAASVSEISKMSPQQIKQLQHDITDSIVYGNGFKQAKRALGFDTGLFKLRHKDAQIAWTNKISQT